MPNTAKYLNAIHRIVELNDEKKEIKPFLEEALATILSTGDFLQQGAIFTVDKSTQKLTLQTESFLPAHLQESYSNVSLGTFLTDQAVATDETIFQACMEEDQGTTSQHKPIQSYGYIIVPIKSENEVLGVINVFLKADQKKNTEDIVFLEKTAMLLGHFLKRSNHKKELKKIHRQRNLLFNYLNMANILTETDLAGNITYANESFCKISKYREDEILGQNHSIVSSGLHAPEFWEDLWDLINRGGIWRGEICNRDKEGELYWVYTTIFPKFNEDKTLTGFISVRKDITENKLKELKLKKEKEINYKQTKMASLGLIAAGIGHEINNPLAIAVGTARVLERELQGLIEENTTLQKYFHHLRDCHERIKKIVKEVKSFSRNERFEVKPHELKNILMETVESFLPYLGNGQIHIEYEFPPEDVYAMVGKDKIQQVIINLLNNAKDSFQEPKSSIVKAKQSICLRLTEDDEKVYLSFIDNGPGIPPEIAEKVFEYFYSSKDPNKGSGLGLPISLDLCHQMGGSLSLEKSSPNGSIFIIELLKRDYV